MPTIIVEKRKGPRVRIEVGVRVEIHRHNQVASARTVNVGDSGVLVEFDQPLDISCGDRVTCEFSIPYTEHLALPYCGEGRVVRVEGQRAAICLETDEVLLSEQS
jgi:hypothetical protein